jgi:hypothetical protein
MILNVLIRIAESTHRVLVYASKLSFVAPHDDRSDGSEASDRSIVSLVTDSVAFIKFVSPLLPYCCIHRLALCCVL